MIKSRISTALMVLAGSAALGACTAMGPYGGVGVGVGSGYGNPYGYGSPYGYGYGSPYGQGIYGYGGYPYSSYYAGHPYYGWYDGFYYPGAGYYVYDPYGGRYPITERQSRYWQNIRERFRKARGEQASAEVKENWTGFASRAKVAAPVNGTTDATATATGTADQRALRQISESRQQARAERLERARAERVERVERIERQQQVRSENQDGIRQQILERREQRRTSRPTDE